MQYSIIVPYKETDIKILRDCLDSINQQTFGDFEVIFIHNGNTNLNEEIEKYNFKNKIIIEQKLETPNIIEILEYRKLLENTFYLWTEMIILP